MWSLRVGIFLEDNVYEAAAHAKVIDHDQLTQIKPYFSSRFSLMPAVFDQHYVKRLNGTNVKKGKHKCDLAMQLIADIQAFKQKVDRVVVLWAGSTEIFLEPTAVHQSIAAFEKGMVENDPSIAPSQIYAYAALKEGVPFANGAPNLTVDLPCMVELSKMYGAPITGKDFKTGQTFLKTVLAPAFKARMLGVAGWYSTNILGNRDGEVLDDPESFKTKEESKLGVLDYILQPELYPDLYKGICESQGEDQLLSAARGPTRRAGITSISSAGLGVSDADQSGFPVPGLDSGGSDCAGSGVVSGSGEAHAAVGEYSGIFRSG